MHTYPVEVNSTLWSFEMCVRGASPPNTRKTGTFIMANRTIIATTADANSSSCFEQYLITEDQRHLIERLLLERLSLRGICRAVGITLKWLLGFLVQCFEALPDHLHVHPVSCQRDVLIQRLEAEADELASFVQKKAHKQWVWIAMDAKTRQIIAFTWAIVATRVPSTCGPRSRQPTGSTRPFARINMWCMRR